MRIRISPLRSVRGTTGLPPASEETQTRTHVTCFRARFVLRDPEAAPNLRKSAPQLAPPSWRAGENLCDWSALPSPEVTGKVTGGEGRPCSSIPVKFQTKVISNSERKGFNSQAKRFQHIENENPGPGFYDVTHPSALLHNVSQSQKGTCFFPSLDVRIARQRIPNYPAANAYNLPPTLQSKRDFSLGYSSMFQLPIARKITKKSTPAPNQYNVSVDLGKQSSSPGAQSAFTSRTKRTLILHSKDHVPSPCHYRVNDSVVRQSPVVLVSCFKSKTSRETHPETLSPGPAAYQHPAEVSVAAPRKSPGLRKYGLNFSAPAVPPPKGPPLPGPGQYEVVNYGGPPKHYISSAVFVSSTGRSVGDKFHEEIPGPGAYNLPIPRKQSFIYNTDNKWVPVL